MNLDATVVEATHHAIKRYVKELERAKLPVPHSLRQVKEFWELQFRCALSSERHQSSDDPEQWIPSREAAEMLVWNIRTVQRRKADLGGKRMGRSLMFPAATVKEVQRGNRNRPRAA
jgi:hypothetical protein